MRITSAERIYMGIVTTIETNRREALIYIDGTLFLRLKKSDYEAFPLSEGDDLDEAAYIDRLCARQSKRAYDEALDLLSIRDMTASGLRQSLIKKGFLDKVAETVVERLIENRLIDDERFAKRYIELRKDSVLGKYALSRKLRAKGIDRETTSAALEQINDSEQLEACKRLAESLLTKYRNEEPRRLRMKLGQALARRGFSWEIVSEALEAVAQNDDYEDSP